MLDKIKYLHILNIKFALLILRKEGFMAARLRHRSLALIAQFTVPRTKEPVRRALLAATASAAAPEYLPLAVPRQRPRAGITGALIATASLLSLVYVLVRAAGAGWGDHGTAP
jgi:hypothetical protein